MSLFRWVASALGVCLAVIGCTPKPGASLGLELSLYSGIRQIANIGDPEERILEKGAAWKPERVTLPPSPVLEKVRFSHLIFFPSIGTRAYIRNGRVALIEVQDPFQGVVQGKKLTVFKMESSKGMPWSEVLINELGPPTARTGGGSFGSEAMYYSWGDVSFNASGPNEIAIYRDPEIAKYRQSNFGRKINLF